MFETEIEKTELERIFDTEVEEPEQTEFKRTMLFDSEEDEDEETERKRLEKNEVVRHLLTPPLNKKLQPAAGSTKPRTRVGRGHAAGKGKQAGRGQSGQKKRSKVRIGFEGGQNPWYRRIPKRGFNSLAPKRFEAISLDTLQIHFMEEPNALITRETLKAKNLLRRNYPPKILGGFIHTPITVEGVACSKSARKDIEAVGGEVK